MTEIQKLKILLRCWEVFMVVGTITLSILVYLNVNAYSKLLEML